MLTQALRFGLLRFLPRRLLPLLTVYEIFRMVQRLRRRTPAPVAPRRLVTVDGSAQRVGDTPITYESPRAARR